jgi:hypothetical protein
MITSFFRIRPSLGPIRRSCWSIVGLTCTVVRYSVCLMLKIALLKFLVAAASGWAILNLL